MSGDGKRGPGRPRLEPGKARDVILSIRLTAEQMADLERRAKDDGYTPSRLAAYYVEHELEILGLREDHARTR